MAEWDPEVRDPQPFQEIWDPKLGRNVSLSQQGASGAGEYINNNAGNYQGYTGPVASVGGTPISADTLAGWGTPQSTEPGATFDPEAYRRTQERFTMNPYDRTEMDKATNQWMQSVKIIPGANPTYGILPGTDRFYNLLTGKEEDKSKLDRETLAFGNLTSQRGGNIPSFAQWSEAGGKLSGRGYNLRGNASPEEQAALDRFLAGDMSQAGELARARMQRWEVNKLSGMKEFANKYYGPFIAAMSMAPVGPGVGAAFGPVAGALAGGAAGAFTSGGMSRWENPAAIAAGAVGGAAGGFGGGQLASAIGAGPVASGALQSGGSALGRNLTEGAVSGNLNPYDLLRDVGIGAATGGVGGFITGLSQPGQFTPEPGTPGGGFRTPPPVPPGFTRIVAPPAASAVGNTLDYYLPGRQEPPRISQRQLRRRPRRRVR